MEKPKARAMVIKICPIPVNTEGIPTSLISLILRFKPTKNSRNAIPM